jgi:PadR family transcriptional regulator, regulatory protein PadR
MVHRMALLPTHLFSGESVELRRGILTLAVMSRLREPRYGYSLRQILSRNGLNVEEGTLYPLLRRCEQKGLLSSAWQLQDGKQRRYYLLTEQGGQVLDGLTCEWKLLVTSMNELIATVA